MFSAFAEASVSSGGAELAGDQAPGSAMHWGAAGNEESEEAAGAAVGSQLSSSKVVRVGWLVCLFSVERPGALM